MMIEDSKAFELEARGFYRRAAARWADVIMLVNSDEEREQAVKRRSACIRKVKGVTINRKTGKLQKFTGSHQSCTF